MAAFALTSARLGTRLVRDYLFVVPALVASHTLSPNRYALVFGVFLYFQLWMLTTEWAYRSAVALYRFHREYLWPLPYVRRHTNRMASGFETVFSCLFSYFFTVYGFALAYTFLSSFDPKAFNVGELSIFSGTYFSIATAATVGYGDIVPLSVTARSLVMVEIVVSLLYAVLLFSVLASGCARWQRC
jgi:hypothetical protein